MRVALAGKGGAGKTTLSATLARLLAAEGITVVAVDADSNPNLGLALGLGRDIVPVGLPASVVSRKIGGPGLTMGVDETLAAHGLVGPDGIRLIHMGMPLHADEGCLCSAHAAVSALLGDLGEDPATVTLVDMEASPEHLSRGTARHVDLLLLVAEPYYRALETARRLAVLAAELPIPRVAVVTNKIRSDSDTQAVRAFCERHDIELIATIPWDDEVLGADVDRRPLVDAAPDGAVMRAMPELIAAAGFVRRPAVREP